MDRDLLESYLNDGLSLEQIGTLENRHPSTIGYWVKKHGLLANGHDMHAARGGLPSEVLADLIEDGFSQRQIAEALGVSQATVRHWLERYGLRTSRRHRVRPGETRPRIEGICRVHGRADFYRRSDAGYRCTQCNQEAVAERRRKVKRILVEEAGGSCVVCGYDKCPRNLHFHHLDPSEKSFALSGRGFCRSLARLRDEAKKCVLLCGNCHYEVEEGVTELSWR